MVCPGHGRGQNRVCVLPVFLSPRSGVAVTGDMQPGHATRGARMGDRWPWRCHCGCSDTRGQAAMELCKGWSKDSLICLTTIIRD